MVKSERFKGLDVKSFYLNSDGDIHSQISALESLIEFLTNRLARLKELARSTLEKRSDIAERRAPGSSFHGTPWMPGGCSGNT